MAFDGCVVPESLRPYVDWVTAMAWPEGDPQGCFRMADACVVAAHRTVAGTASADPRTARLIGDAWDGAAQQAFAEHVRTSVGGRQADLVKRLVDAAVSLNGVGLAIQHAQRMITLIVMCLLTALPLLIWQAPWLLRTTLQVARGTALQVARTTGLLMAMFAGFGLAMEGATQYSQIVGGRRDGFDGQQLWMAARDGLINGLLTGLLGAGLGRLATPALRAGIARAESSFGERLLALMMTTAPGQMLQYGVTGAATSAISMALDGQPLDWDLVLKGGVAAGLGADGQHLATPHLTNHHTGSAAPVHSLDSAGSAAHRADGADGATSVRQAGSGTTTLARAVPDDRPQIPPQSGLPDGGPTRAHAPDPSATPSPAVPTVPRPRDAATIPDAAIPNAAVPDARTHDVPSSHLSGEPSRGSISDMINRSEPPGRSPFQILEDGGTSGDAFVDGARRLWGTHGAASLLVMNIAPDGTPRVLVSQRSAYISDPGKWSTIGGALKSAENPYQGSAREFSEEVGVGQAYLDKLRLVGEHVMRGPHNWRHTTLLVLGDRFDPHIDGRETSAARWVTLPELIDMAARRQLLPAFRSSLPEILRQFGDVTHIGDDLLAPFHRPPLSRPTVHHGPRRQADLQPLPLDPAHIDSVNARIQGLRAEFISERSDPAVTRSDDFEVVDRTARMLADTMRSDTSDMLNAGLSTLDAEAVGRSDFMLNLVQVFRKGEFVSEMLTTEQIRTSAAPDWSAFRQFLFSQLDYTKPELSLHSFVDDEPATPEVLREMTELSFGLYGDSADHADLSARVRDVVERHQDFFKESADRVSEAAEEFLRDIPMTEPRLLYDGPEYVPRRRNLGDDFESVPVRSIRCDDPEAMRIMRVEAAHTLVRIWRDGAGGHTPEGMAMHEAARLEFHLTEAVEGPIISRDPRWNDWAEEASARSGDVYRDVMRSLYEVTQRELAGQGITEVMLYRGMRWDDPAFPMPEWARVPDGTVIESLAMRPLQSWTSDPDIATMYAFPADDSSMVVGSAVPAVRLLTTPWMGVGAASLNEFVVLSADGLVTTVRGPR